MTADALRQRNYQRGCHFALSCRLGRQTAPAIVGLWSVPHWDTQDSRDCEALITGIKFAIPHTSAIEAGGFHQRQCSLKIRQRFSQHWQFRVFSLRTPNGFFYLVRFVPLKWYR